MAHWLARFASRDIIVLGCSFWVYGVTIRIRGSCHSHCMLMLSPRYVIIDGRWLEPRTWHRRGGPNVKAARRFYA